MAARGVIQIIGQTICMCDRACNIADERAAVLQQPEAVGENRQPRGKRRARRCLRRREAARLQRGDGIQIRDRRGADGEMRKIMVHRWPPG